MDDEQQYAAASSRDARFDGVFFTAVRTTGIYCRPSCPAMTPRRENVVFYPTAAAAQQAGFRACKRCRPDASPGSPEWNVRSDVAGRAMRLIADGVVDRSGVPGLAASLGYSPRQVGRLLDRRGRRGAAGARPGAAGPDRARPGRDLVPADGRHRLRRRVHLDQAVQRDDARGVRHAAFRAARAGQAARRARVDQDRVDQHRASQDRAGQGGHRRAAAATGVPPADRPGPDVPLPGRARHSRDRGRLSR